MGKSDHTTKSLILLLCLYTALIALFTSTTYLSQDTSAATNDTNIVLVHGSWNDGSVWNKVIPFLVNSGYKVIATQLPLHSLVGDVDTVERAIEQIGGPAILVGHSYGGEVITNAGYNNSNVTGLVYLAAIAPDEGETGNDLFENIPEDVGADMLKTFLDNIATDNAGFLYFNPDKFHEFFAHDVDPAESDILATVQKPFNQSIGMEKSGPPAWKQIPTWYQISEQDRLIPPNIQRIFAERMNATILSLNSSHMSPISQPEEIAELIINATKEGK
jgi:pimeloyl-ACP methyl ester carboxylesterase